MDWTSRRDLLRTIVGGNRCVFPAGIYDGIGARIAEDLGFETLMLPGSVASFSTLAAPDICVMTLSEFAAQAYLINRAAKLPLLVDADHGFGNALNVKRTVEELETAGVSGLTIEDTLLPAAFGSGGKPSLISIEEGVGKMRAAIAGRQDPRLLIVARTSAVAISGIPDTIARVRAYEATGVDMVFLGGITTREQIDEITSAVSLPIFMGNIPDELRDADYLSARNVRICLLGNDYSFWAAVNGLYEALKALREGASPKDLTIAPPELQKRLLRSDDYKSWQTDFLS